REAVVAADLATAEPSIRGPTRSRNRAGDPDVAVGIVSPARVLGGKHFADPATAAELLSCRLAPCCGARAAVTEAWAAGPRHHRRWPEADADLAGSVGPAGIISAVHGRRSPTISATAGLQLTR